jgi:hypothetical protein
MQINHYEYSRHSTEQKARDALENYYAEGIVCSGERPRVVLVVDHHQRLRYYAVEFGEWSA